MPRAVTLAAGAANKAALGLGYVLLGYLLFESSKTVIVARRNRRSRPI